MKRCRHCGTENPDGLAVCTECGLEMSQSPARRLLSKLAVIPASIGKIKLKWPRRILVGTSVLLGVMTVYMLSLGPILRLYDVRPSSGWNRLPKVVRFIYGPLDKLPIPEFVARMHRSYNRWWMRASEEKADYLRLIQDLDRSLSVGTLQSEVVRGLGQPSRWETNAGVIVADYRFGYPRMVYFGLFTNGFRIDFSNGFVIGKSPNKVFATETSSTEDFRSHP